MLNRLRGFALFLVVAYHCGGILKWENVMHGEAGVDIFLMISGYLLAIGSADTPAREFLARRFFRIFPAYWAALALFLVLEVLFKGTARGWADIALHIAGLQGFSRARYMIGINDSFWFISIIMFCYLLFLAVRTRLGDLAFILRSGALASAGLAVFLLWGQHFENVGYMVPRVPDFFLGLVAGSLASGRELKFKPDLALALALLVAGFVWVSYGIDGHDMLWASLYILAYMGIDAALSASAAGRAVLWIPTAAGTLSYEIYLLHQPLMRDYSRMVMERCGVAAPTQGQMMIAMAVAFGAACLGAMALHRLIGMSRALRFRNAGSAQKFPAVASAGPD